MIVLSLPPIILFKPYTLFPLLLLPVYPSFVDPSAVPSGALPHTSTSLKHLFLWDFWAPLAKVPLSLLFSEAGPVCPCHALYATGLERKENISFSFSLSLLTITPPFSFKNPSSEVPCLIGTLGILVYGDNWAMTQRPVLLEEDVYDLTLPRRWGDMPHLLRTTWGSGRFWSGGRSRSEGQAESRVSSLGLTTLGNSGVFGLSGWPLVAWYLALGWFGAEWTLAFYVSLIRRELGVAGLHVRGTLPSKVVHSLEISLPWEGGLSLASKISGCRNIMRYRK